MKKICLKISYKGNNYSGWQRQKNAVSIQETIEEGIYKLTNYRTSLYGASRTDAGVHAKSQYATFYDNNSSIPADKYLFALNALLPRDIRIIESFQCNETFNPRYDAIYKVYSYLIYNKPYSSALWNDLSSQIPDKLDLIKMHNSAKILIGTHDFSAFESSGANVRDKVRTIYESSIMINGNFIEYRVKGNGFLYNMVRIIVGTLIDIGRGRLESECFSSAFSTGQRSCLGFTAEAKGLYLEEISYEDNLRKENQNETI